MNPDKPENKMLFTSEEVEQAHKPIKELHDKFKRFEGFHLNDVLQRMNNFLKEGHEYINHTHQILQPYEQQPREKHIVILIYY